MPIQTITWHAHVDEKTCPICKALNGFTWRFQAGKDIMTDALFHPVFGIVWSLSQGSNAHDHTFGGAYGSGDENNCRCFLDGYKLDLEDVLAKCVFLKETLTTTATEISDTKKGSYRRTTPEDIGIDLSKYGFE
jgi:hypothetical protein